MLTIYNTIVPVTSKEQAYRLKQVCIDYGLKIKKDKNSFDYSEKEKNYFYFNSAGFSIGWFDHEPFKVIITESEWIKLLTKSETKISNPRMNNTDGIYASEERTEDFYSLRDFFAGSFLQGYLASEYYAGINTSKENIIEIAKTAYLFADTMLEVRCCENES